MTKPAIAPCRARDLHELVAVIRQAEKSLAPTLKKQKEDGAPVACRGEADNRKGSAFVDVFSKDASGCVARDSELDSQWNLVQSAVTALDGCVDCTRPRAARTLSCQRADELLAAAEKRPPSRRALSSTRRRDSHRERRGSVSPAPGSHAACSTCRRPSFTWTSAPTVSSKPAASQARSASTNPTRRREA